MSQQLMVTDDKVVFIAYTLKNADGELIDESGADEPLAYLHGHDNLLPAFEGQLSGQSPGFKTSFILSPSEGYGERVDGLEQKIDRKLLPQDQTPEVGMTLYANLGQGPRPYEITRVTDSEIAIDLNHPLAGVELHFDVEVLRIRDARKDEIEHGHPHEGHHHHH